MGQQGNRFGDLLLPQRTQVRTPVPIQTDRVGWDLALQEQGLHVAQLFHPFRHIQDALPPALRDQIGRREGLARATRRRHHDFAMLAEDLLVVVDIERSRRAAGTAGGASIVTDASRRDHCRGRVDRLTTAEDIVPIVPVAGWVVTCDLDTGVPQRACELSGHRSPCLVIIQGQEKVAHTGCREGLQRLHKLCPIRGRVEDDVPGIVSRQELRIGQGGKHAFTDNAGRRVRRQWGQGEMFVMPPRRDFLPPCVDRTDRPEFVVPGAGGPGQIRLSVIRRFLQEPETLHDGAVDAPGG